MATIGFVGLGNMGAPMAANAVKAGHVVRGYDLSPARREIAAKDGVLIASSIADAAKGADIFISMLSSGSIVINVWQEAIPLLPPHALAVDCSTVDIDSTRAAHALAHTAGLLSIDAPVSGGTQGASGATLTFMVGGSDQAFAQAQPLLATMGRKIVHCGQAGTGTAAKICNNMILGISMIGVSEAFVLAQSLGLSHQALFDVASTASGQCYALTTHCPVPGPVPTSAANAGYKPGFAAELMSKDLRLSQECAHSSGVATPLGAAASQLYEHYVANGGRGIDYTGIVQFIERGQAPA